MACTALVLQACCPVMCAGPDASCAMQGHAACCRHSITSQKRVTYFVCECFMPTVAPPSLCTLLLLHPAAAAAATVLLPLLLQL
jgi:hypothetical protein